MQNIPGPGISIVVISVISTSPVPVTNFQFQAAVPKVSLLPAMHVHTCYPTFMSVSVCVCVCAGDESEAATPHRYGVGGLQPSHASLQHFTDYVTSQPNQGELHVG